MVRRRSPAPAMAAGDTARLYHRLTSSRYGPGLEWPEPGRPVPVGDPRMLAGLRPAGHGAPAGAVQGVSAGLAGRRAAARLGAGRRIGDLGARRPARRNADRPRPARTRPAAPPVRRRRSRHGARRSSLAVPRGRLGGRPLPARGLRLGPRRRRASGRRALVRPGRPRARPGRAAGGRRGHDADRHRRPVADRLEIRGARPSSRLLGRRDDARPDARAGGFGAGSARGCGRASPTSRSRGWSAPTASTSSRSRWSASATASRRSGPPARLRAAPSTRRRPSSRSSRARSTRATATASASHGRSARPCPIRRPPRTISMPSSCAAVRRASWIRARRCRGERLRLVVGGLAAGHPRPAFRRRPRGRGTGAGPLSLARPRPSAAPRFAARRALPRLLRPGPVSRRLLRRHGRDRPGQSRRLRLPRGPDRCRHRRRPPPPRRVRAWVRRIRDDLPRLGARASARRAVGGLLFTCVGMPTYRNKPGGRPG